MFICENNIGKKITYKGVQACQCNQKNVYIYISVCNLNNRIT